MFSVNCKHAFVFALNSRAKRKHDKIRPATTALIHFVQLKVAETGWKKRSDLLSENLVLSVVMKTD
ncbi:hypothetical protein HNQ38_002896 [Desulfovibrio intestinalis]|uniref:Uncharacterized protein n=1 Tax=Desulfovibrio intestinalis TaxID=58621 RepID=A0A7W8C3D3_9BACT|nr:hypothetical protein [Desulfovibrio intestinalis]